MSKYKDVLDSFDFKEFIYEKLDLISNPVGKRIVMGDNFNEDQLFMHTGDKGKPLGLQN